MSRSTHRDDDFVEAPFRPTNCVPPPIGDALRRRDSGAIRRDRLRLVLEDFARTGVHEHFDPVHVVVPVRLVVSEQRRRTGATGITEPVPAGLTNRSEDVVGGVMGGRIRLRRSSQPARE
jgi:hypothetical protein